MSEKEQNSNEPKKMTLQEAIKHKLAQKNQKSNEANSFNGSTSTKKLTNQQAKKTSNRRKQMGT